MLSLLGKNQGVEISRTVDFNFSSKRLWGTLHKFFFFTCLQNIIYDTVTATSCWWCHTWLFTFCHPDFNFRKLHGSEMQRDVKKHVLWLITPQTCWEHRHYVMPDRAPLHQDINSSLFVRTTKRIGRLLFHSFSVRKAVSSLVRAIWGKQTLGPQKDDVTDKEHWQGRVGLY